jgi:glycine cleavage system H lipoate-binding protein
MLPGRDGFQFLEEAAQREVTAPVVMATGYSTVENAVRSLTAGAVDFVSKPFTADELLSVVHRGLEHNKLRATPAAAAPGAIPFAPCPPGRYRLGSMSWLKTEPAGTVLLGLADAFLKTLDGVRAVELSAAGDEVSQGRTCAIVVAQDGRRHGVICPVSGRVVEANAGLCDPALIEKDPYDGGWLYRVLPSDLDYDLRRLTISSPDRL